MSTADMDTTPSTLLCPGCRHPFSFYQVGELLCSFDVTCENCDVNAVMGRVIVTVAPGQDELLEESTARAAVWYHATSRENWIEGVQESRVLVHVGTLNAAIERGWKEYARHGKDFIIYQIRLNSDAVLDRSIAADENSWDEDIPEGFVAQRYLNRWESPGSISMVVDPKNISVVGSSTMTAYEASDAIPSYMYDE